MTAHFVFHCLRINLLIATINSEVEINIENEREALRGCDNYRVCRLCRV